MGGDNTKTVQDILTEIYGKPVDILPTGFRVFPDGKTNVDYRPSGKLVLKDGVYSYYPYDINEPTVEEAKKCTCGATKTYPNEPNLEYLHSDWCDLYKSNK